MNRIARDSSMKAALVLAMAMASGSATALGLGQLQLKSKPGEPLLAEIAIVSSDPAELEQLRAGLASPATFARVGLQPPDDTVARLRFEPALNDAGESVIRVTSTQPIEQPVLTFLIEVDWGQGRLVREYSTLMDAPRTVSAPWQPPIDAPVVAPSSTIVRAPIVAPAAPEVASTEVAPPVARPMAAPPAAVARAITPDPSQVAPPAPPRPAAITEAPQAPRTNGPITVAQGDTLSQIASRMNLGVSLDQAMVALLRANPDAFVDDNVNLLKQGAVLHRPQAAQLDRIDRTDASALVRAQTEQWRQARPAAAQPSADAVANTDSAIAPGNTRQAAGGARLEIVPPGASRARQAGTQSGISAGGEGEMLRQELQQTKETLAAREAELAEMQNRIAELEKLQGDQAQLLSMKDSELAAAQQRLATTQSATPPPAEGARTSSLPWIVGGVALLLAVLVGWAWRRRSAATPRFRAPSTAPRASLADAFAPENLKPASDAIAPAPLTSAAAEAISTDAPVAAGVAPAESLPLWNQRERPRHDNRASVLAVSAAPVPAWHEAKSAPQADDATVAPGARGQERLDLARAYLDLGDHVSARLLLVEVAAGGDPDDSHQATRMLRELE